MKIHKAEAIGDKLLTWQACKDKIIHHIKLNDQLIHEGNCINEAERKYNEEQIKLQLDKANKHYYNNHLKERYDRHR